MRARNYLRALGAWGGGRPVYAHYGVTHRCNLRCPMCTVWGTARPERELLLPEIGKLARNLGDLGIVRISLGGGEPLLRSDLPDIIREFRSAGLDVHLLTNGCSAPPDRIREAVAAGLSGVSVSLDTLDPDRAGFIFGSAYSLARVCDTLSIFSQLLPVRGSSCLINTVVSRLNLPEIPSLVSFAARIGYRISLIPIVLVSAPDRTDGFAGYAPEFAVRPEDCPIVDEVYAYLTRRRASGPAVFNSRIFLEKSARYLKTGEPVRRCHAGGLYFSVSPEGRISFCHREGGEIGDWSDNLSALVETPEYRERLASFKSACPGCIRPCWLEVTYAFSSPAAAWGAARTHWRGFFPRRAVSSEEVGTAARECLRTRDDRNRGGGREPAAG